MDKHEVQSLGTVHGRSIYEKTSSRSDKIGIWQIIKRTSRIPVNQSKNEYTVNMVMSDKGLRTI